MVEFRTRHKDKQIFPIEGSKSYKPNYDTPSLNQLKEERRKMNAPKVYRTKRSDGSVFLVIVYEDREEVYEMKSSSSFKSIKENNDLESYDREDAERLCKDSGGYEIHSKNLLDNWEGLSKFRKKGDFDPFELEQGTAVEMEHTDNKAIAERIAMDHLTEDRDYYKKLEKIHKEK